MRRRRAQLALLAQPLLNHLTLTEIEALPDMELQRLLEALQ